MNKEEILDEIECLLWQLKDVVKTKDRFDTIDRKCYDYDFSQTVMELCEKERIYIYRSIEKLIENLLPSKSLEQHGFFSKLFYKSTMLHRVRIEPQNIWHSFYKNKIILHGFETECSEFYCLIKRFRKVGKDMWRKDHPYMEHSCGKFLVGYDIDYGEEYVLYLEM